ncbi:MAG TPA: YceH family protein [Sphingobacteriaceae bacterium]
MEQLQQLPVLDTVEVRVLGSLIEKSRTTPDYYPMTLNGLLAACNQKTSRNPVVQFDEETVISALNTLKKRGLISTVTGGASRATKYKHNLGSVYPLVPADLALICLMMLRGPQTPGELNTHAGRLYEFDSIEDVQAALENLMQGENPYVVQLPRRSGQKELRYMHLFAGTPDISQFEVSREADRGSGNLLEERLAHVEQELAELKAAFEQLMKELNG